MSSNDIDEPDETLDDGSFPESTQMFLNITDDLGVLSKNNTECGRVVYTLEDNKTSTPAPDFMQVLNNKITVKPSIASHIGSYVIDLKFTFIGENANKVFRQTFIVTVSENI
jgi:hypothetical protein